MLKLLYKWFPESFHKLVFESQRKPINFDKLKFTFVDSEGRRYFQYMSDFDLSIKRKGALEMKVKELTMGLDRDELTGIVDAMDAALKAKDGRGNMTPNIARIGYFIEEIRNRKENLWHPGILMEMAALMNIREDEDPAIIDEDIQSQKVAQFEKDSETGLYDFFLTAGLTAYFPFLKQSGGDWEKIFKEQKATLEGYRAMMKSFSTEEQ